MYVLFQIEQLVRLELPCVRHVMVVGEGQDHLAALLTLHTDVDENTKLPGNVLTEDVRRWFRQSRYVYCMLKVLIGFSRWE